MHVDAIAGLGEGQDQWNADVAAAADHGQVDGIDLSGYGPRRLGTGKIHVKLSEVQRRTRASGVIAQLPGFSKTGHRGLEGAVNDFDRFFHLAVKARAEPAVASPACRGSPWRGAWAQARRRCARRR